MWFLSRDLPTAVRIRRSSIRYYTELPFATKILLVVVAGMALTMCSHTATVPSWLKSEKQTFSSDGSDDLCDLQAKARVQARIERLAAGNPGDVEPVGEGVSKLRINYGPGYRVYFKKRGQYLIILLAGGDKSTQAKDIKTALRLARNLLE